MTPQRAKELIPIIEAIAKGKILEIRIKPNGKWLVNSFSNHGAAFENTNYDWRIKSEAKYRPWRMEEVPVGGLLRWKGESTNKSVILTIDNQEDVCIYFFNSLSEKSDRIPTYNYASTCLKDMEYSIDFGKTWQPCGVLES